MRSRALLLFTALLSASSGLTLATAQVTLQPAPVTVHPHAAFIAEASQRFDIPEHWIWAVLRVESAGDVRSISSAGAMGLMQVMPDTWAGLSSRHGFGRDPYDPRDNILAGTAYLREMWIAMAMSRPCLPPTMPVPAAMTSIWRQAARCPQKHAPM